MKAILKKSLEILLRQDELDIFEHAEKDSDFFKKERKNLLEEISKIERLLMNINKFLEFDEKLKCEKCGATGSWNFLGKIVCPDCLEKCLE